MLDVCRNHSSSFSYFLTYKCRCDVCLDAQLLAVHVLADGNILHLLRDDALLGEVHLCLSLLTSVYP